MKNLTSFVLTVIVMMFASSARADNFEHSSSFGTNDTFSGGSAVHWSGGSNALCTNIATSIAYTADNGQIFVSVFTRYNGVWGDPTIESSWYDYLGDQGLHSFVSFQLSEIEMNGDIWTTTESLYISADSSYYLLRDDEHTLMQGITNTLTFGDGLIPVQANSSLSITNMQGYNGWQLECTSTWMVADMSSFTVVPGPGGMTLMSIGVVARFRRRIRN